MPGFRSNRWPSILTPRFFAFALCVATAPVCAQAALDDYPSVKLRSLDKITARTMTFDAKVGDTLRYGPLYIKIQACRKAPPIEQPESAAFLQIWEVTPKNESKWVFSGWMFASSPALSSMDHPVYDVWVIDCLGEPRISSEPPPLTPAAPPPEGMEAPDDATVAPQAPAESGAIQREDLLAPQPSGAPPAATP